MAGEQPSYETGEGDDTQDTHYDDQSTAAIAGSTTIAPDDDYAEEPVEDYVVNLSVNEEGAGVTIPPKVLVNEYVTDISGKVIGTKPSLYEQLTTGVYDELNGNNTALTGNKGLFGWSTLKLILVGLAILCIIALILGILFFLFGKKFKKSKRPTATGGTTTTTKAVVNKGITSQDPKYQPVPNV